MRDVIMTSETDEQIGLMSMTINKLIKDQSSFRSYICNKCYKIMNLGTWTSVLVYHICNYADSVFFFVIIAFFTFGFVFNVFFVILMFFFSIINGVKEVINVICDRCDACVPCNAQIVQKRGHM